MSMESPQSPPDAPQLSLNYEDQPPASDSSPVRSEGRPPPARPKGSQLPVTPVNRPKRASRLAFLGPPPLIWGEDPDAYNEHQARFSAALGPSDYIEEFWAREGADLLWEILRYRRQKVKLQHEAAADELEEVLASLVGDRTSAEELAGNWIKGRKSAIEKVDRLLAKARMSWDDIVARSLPRWLDSSVVFDEKIRSTHARFSALLREIDEHRTTFGQSVRRTAQQVDDAEYHFSDMPKGVQKLDKPEKVDG